MPKLFAHLPIFRRLLLAFLLAALIPDSILLIMGFTSIQTLKAHGIDSSYTNSLLINITIAILASTAVVVILGYIMNLTISHPLSNLVLLTRRIGRGDTNARAEIVGRDEISIVSSSINRMLDTMVQMIQEKQSQSDLLHARIEKLVKEVSGVGEGDLCVEADVTQDTLGVLADSFNYMIKELHNLVVRVKIMSQEVQNSTVHTHQNIIQLVRNIEIRLKQMATAAREVEVMATSSRQVAEHVQALDDISRETYQLAPKGYKMLQETITGMDQMFSTIHTTTQKVEILGNHSREINQIVDVISTIAHQTNRLALDATVQAAATSGENSKGFGPLVADIRRLAERSKEQANKVTSIVHNVQDDIESVATSIRATEKETTTGSQMIQEINFILTTIFANIEQQSHDIQQSNQLAKRLLVASDNTVKIIQDASEATKQGSLSARTAAQYMEYLAGQATSLQESVQVFKVKPEA